MKNAEIWKPVLGFEGLYEVSDLGRVRSLDRIIHHAKNGPTKLSGKLLSVAVYKGAIYAQVMLSKAGKCGSKLVHILVCEAFHGPRPKGMWVRHLNGDCLYNRPGNLRWGTPKENMDDQFRHGTRIFASKIPHSKLTADAVRIIRKRAKEGETQTALGREFGVRQGTICHIINRRAWAHVD